jgi:hypothetical protein
MLTRAVFRRHVAVVAVLLLGAALSACGGASAPQGGGGTTTTSPRTATTSAATSTTAPGTQEVGFDPFSPQGTIRPPWVVSHTVSGTCVASGVAGATSYRCFGQPQAGIYDPCFAPPNAKSGPLVCVADPTTTDVVQFDTGTLPTAPAGVPPTRPWAMRLPNGQVCVLVDAAWGGLGPFACPVPVATSPVADCHVPTQGAPWWNAACQIQENASSPFVEVRITMLWT